MPPTRPYKYYVYNSLIWFHRCGRINWSVRPLLSSRRRSERNDSIESFRRRRQIQMFFPFPFSISLPLSVFHHIYHHHLLFPFLFLFRLLLHFNENEKKNKNKISTVLVGGGVFDGGKNGRCRRRCAWPITVVRALYRNKTEKRVFLLLNWFDFDFEMFVYFRRVFIPFESLTATSSWNQIIARRRRLVMTTWYHYQRGCVSEDKIS